jgi:hypothetical protein
MNARNLLAGLHINERDMMCLTKKFSSEKLLHLKHALRTIPISSSECK